MASDARAAKRTREFFQKRRKERRAVIKAFNGERKDFTGAEYFQAKLELLNDYIKGLQEEFNKIEWKNDLMKAFAQKSLDASIQKAKAAHKKKYGNNKYLPGVGLLVSPAQ